MNDSINTGTDGDATDSTADDPTDMSVGTFDPSDDSTTSASNAPGATGSDSDVEAVDAVMDALPGGGRLDEPEGDPSGGASGPVQVP